MRVFAAVDHNHAEMMAVKPLPCFFNTEVEKRFIFYKLCNRSRH